MTIHPHHGLLRAARAQARTERSNTPTRLGRSSSGSSPAATCNGRRIQLRYIGTAKNNAWLHSRCAALNLRTLVNARLTRSGGAWSLA